MTITQMLNQAITNDLLIKNPASGIKLPVSMKQSNKRALTDDETQKIHSLKLDQKIRCFVYLLMYTGMRKGEALTLTKDDIDKEKKKSRSIRHLFLRLISLL